MGKRHSGNRRKKTKGRGWIWGIAAAAVLLILAGMVYWFLIRGDRAGADRPGAGERQEREGETVKTDTQEEQQETPVGEPENPAAVKVSEIMDSLSLEEKVCQMFMVTPEALTGVECATQAGEATREAFNAYPVGGIIYFSQNLIGPEQTRTMLMNTQSYARERSGFPVFLSVDEEGGTVARVGSNPAFGVPVFGNMSDVGSRGDEQEAYEIGAEIGAYLSSLGFNMDAAPDTDVLTNPANEVVRYRSFGSDPALVSRMAAAELRGLNDQGIIGMYKHFPGHGGTTADSHEGYVYVEENLDQLKSQALVPFQNGIDDGVRVIMVSHIACPNVTGDNTPATLSKTLITDFLREEMGFDGMVITDALNMGAITEQYTADQAAVNAVLAGADMLLMPADFQTAYQGILNAVAEGTLTEERINDSVRRILEIKAEMAE